MIVASFQQYFSIKLVQGNGRVLLSIPAKRLIKLF